MGKPWVYFSVCSLLVTIFVAGVLLNRPHSGSITSRQRKEYLRRARVWYPVDIRTRNIMEGPVSPISVRPEEEVTCKYAEPQGHDAGASPKFKCALYDSGELVRIKFNRRETFGELAASRLLWSLGFYADENYPVRLRCMDCPEKNPGSPQKGERRIERLLDDAVMERKFPGLQMERYSDQGWAWDEMDEVDERAGGATHAELDALKLMAVFLQHTDSKPSQQRLACYEEDVQRSGSEVTCRKPVLMMQDVGATFGMSSKEVNATSSAYLKGWRRTSLWNNTKEREYYEKTGRKTCFGNLTSAFFNGLSDPQISEEGRAFLADLLNQLSDRQIADLFRASRMDRTGEEIDGRLVTVEDWVEAFKAKRAELTSRRCR